ncbi:hypothetical protein K435DRAFT_941360 [Dendrothele bispora CBS 962.96]|uniref:Uncharacterized protein n=1 Tax=Dendrothele bispora (strain CBS 962.96) TaxID=1314807 RepID=A0A4V4HGJ1_DENBC|nr:hypothetical protein K435DRAFT_941360 [Dendrothele bispora CBS 962.96]
MPVQNKMWTLKLKTIFLQSWKTHIPKSSTTAATNDIKDILRTFKKYGVRQEGLAFSRKITRSMPIWYHRHADKKIRKLNHSEASICLKKNHKIFSVGEASDFVIHLGNLNHQPIANCECLPCVTTRVDTQCHNPNRCMNRAKDLLNTLPSKWDPRQQLPEDYEREQGAVGDYDQWSYFDPTVTTKGELSDSLRTFTHGELCNDLPDTRPYDGLNNGGHRWVLF